MNATVLLLLCTILFLCTVIYILYYRGEYWKLHNDLISSDWVESQKIENKIKEIESKIWKEFLE